MTGRVFDFGRLSSVAEIQGSARDYLRLCRAAPTRMAKSLIGSIALVPNPRLPPGTVVMRDAQVRLVEIVNLDDEGVDAD